MRNALPHNDTGGAKKKPISRGTILQTRNSGRPLLAIGAYAALSPGQQGRRAKDPRIQGAKDLAHRPREAEPDAVVAVARIAVAAISRPHAPGADEPGAAAINPVRARR